MLTDISSQTILRSVCLMSVSLTENKLQGTSGYQMKNKAADLSRIGFRLIWNNICARAWKFEIRKSEEWPANNVQASICV